MWHLCFDRGLILQGQVWRLFSYVLTYGYGSSNILLVLIGLLCYFSLQSARCGGREFTLPFSLSALADYISTDRSAMMRELKRLREDGIVDSKGRTITLNR